MLLEKAFLERVQLIVLLQTFDGFDARAVSLDGEQCARFDGPTIDNHCARSAVRRVAPDVCSGEIQILADKMHEQ